MHLTEDQHNVVTRLTGSSVGCLTGYAGTGKTTATRALLPALQGRGLYPLLCAPTHKAAGVITNATGCEATTVHSLLKLVPKFSAGKYTLKQSKPPVLHPSTVIIVDEASMLDIELLSYLRLTQRRLILIGDDGQLPPVSDSNAPPPFLEWVRERDGTVCNLTQILRQAGDNPLPHVAAHLRPGAASPSLPTTDVRGTSGGVLIRNMQAASTAFLNAAQAHDGLDETTVKPWLSYTNMAASRMGHYARIRRYGLEQAMKSLYMPGELMISTSPVVEDDEMVLPTSTTVQVICAVPTRVIEAGKTFEAQVVTVLTRSGGKIQLTAMRYSDKQALLNHLWSVAVNYPRFWYRYAVRMDGIATLRPIYASTVHKAQGSTFTDVFIDLNDFSNPNARPIVQRLLYTALTRASCTATLVGSLKIPLRAPAPPPTPARAPAPPVTKVHPGVDYFWL